MLIDVYSLNVILNAPLYHYIKAKKYCNYMLYITEQTLEVLI